MRKLIAALVVVALVGSLADADVIGHWRLDETTNPSGNTTAFDSSPNGLNGIYQPRGGPGPVVGLPGATPTTGTSADFNGVNDEIYLGSPAALKMPNDFTITAWINPDRTSGVQRLFAQHRGPSLNVGYGFGLLGDDLRFTTWGIQDYNTNTINIPTGRWTHVAVAFDPSNDATFFVNGRARQTVTGASPANVGDYNFFIGREGVIEPFDGRIDDVQVHSGVLTETELQQMVGPVLIGHWKLDETANPSGFTTAEDSSGYRLNGIYQPRSGPGPVVGVPGASPLTGTSADFNGTNDEVYLASPPDLKMGNNFSLMAWINPDRTTGIQRIFSQYLAGGIGYGFGLTGNDLRFTTYGIQDYNTNTIDIPTDKWSHVAVTFDDNNDATFYVNGQPRQTITGASPANIGNNNFFIGSFGTSEYFDGRIDDVRVYTGVLSQAQIQDAIGPILLGHWRLDETVNPSGNTQALDSSGNSLHGIYQPRGGPGPVVGIAGARPNTGTAADFNGGADEVYLASPGELKMGNNFTIAAWVNPDVTGGVQRIFSQYPAGAIGYGFGLVGDDLRFTTYGIQDYNTNTINIPTDHWSHVAVTFDENNDATFYVNGQPRQTILGASPANIGNNNFFIGATGTAERFNGQIDDVQIYSGTLSQVQIQQLSGPILIGHWQLDETVNPSGNTQALDSSGNRLHGIYQPRGGPGPVVGVPGARPDTGTAASFNGAGDEVYLASPGDLKMANNFTLMAWVNPDRIAGVQRIFSQYPAGGVGYGFGLVGDDLRFTTYSIKDYDTNTINVPTDHWTHVAVAFDADNTATFFVNGQPRQTISGLSPANLGNNNFFIGATGTAERFGGQIDDVRVYTGTLGSSDILQMTGPILIGHWKLDETVNPSGFTTAVDSSGNNLNGIYQPRSGPGPIVGVRGAGPNTGTAADFDGGLDEIYLASPGDLKMANNFSIAAWINPDTLSGVQRIFSQYPAGGVGYGFGLIGDELRFTTYSIQDYDTSGLDIAAGEWTHVAVVFNEDNDALFYVDGLLAQTIPGALPANLGNNNFFIGSFGTAERFDGQIDDVMLFSGALSEEQIQEIIRIAMIPEPSTLALVGLGVLAALRRARRRR